MSEIQQNRALEQLRASLDSKEARRLAIMTQVKAKFLKTARYDNLRDAVDTLRNHLLTPRNDKKPLAPGNRREAKALTLIGEAGTGKSWILDRVFLDHPAFPDFGNPEVIGNLVSLRVPAPTSFGHLGCEVLKALGYPIEFNSRTRSDVWSLIHDRVRMLGVTMIHFDEMHNVVLKANTVDRTDTQNAIKNLMTSKDWPVSPIISGLPVLKHFLEQSQEDQRRSLVQEMDPLVAPRDLAMMASLCRSMLEIAELGCHGAILQPLMPRLFHAGLYRLGICIELMHEAIDIALKQSSQDLEREHFVEVYWRRTGCAPVANPFLISDWAVLDCTRVLPKEKISDPDDDTPAEKIKRHRNQRHRRS
jgi:hypothetical protein